MSADTPERQDGTAGTDEARTDGAERNPDAYQEARDVASVTGLKPWRVWTTVVAAVIAALASVATGFWSYRAQHEQNEISRELGLREAALEEEQVRDQVRLRKAEQKERLIEQYLPLILDKDPDKRGQGIAALLSLMNEEEWQAVGRAVEQVDPTVEEELPEFFIDQAAIAAIDWGVTLGGYDTLAEAREVLEQARQADLSPLRLYKKGGQTFVTIAPIDTEAEAEVQLRLAARQLPNNASLVRLGDWCPSPRASSEEPDLFNCVAQVPESLIDTPESEALDELTDLGFRTLVKRDCSPTVQEGRVFRIDKSVASDTESTDDDAAGKTLEVGQTLTVFVSSGPCPNDE